MPKKNEYNYLSAIFVCGDKSPRVAQYKVFNLDIFKKNKDLGIRVRKNPKFEERIVELSEHAQLSAIINSNSMTKNFAPIVSYIDTQRLINISDIVFNSLEFEVYNKDIKSLINRKIEAVSSLIRAFYKKDVSSFPLLINDFPNISKLILDKSLTIFK
jgi:hypothetical protein